MTDKTRKKIILVTFIYVFMIISFLAPFIATEGANKTIGFVIVGIITIAYLLFLLTVFWDWYKER